MALEIANILEEEIANVQKVGIKPEVINHILLVQNIDQTNYYYYFDEARYIY